MDDLEKDLEDIPTDRLKRQYIRHREKQLRKQYGKEIKKLTISQGLLLIKLIDRETGDTSYQILKELKGGLLAGTFQGLARLFGHDLKSKYDPDGEDKEIELLIKKYENGQL